VLFVAVFLVADFLAAFFAGVATSTPSKPNDVANLLAALETVAFVENKVLPSFRVSLVGFNPGTDTVPSHVGFSPSVFAFFSVTLTVKLAITPSKNLVSGKTVFSNNQTRFIGSACLTEVDFSVQPLRLGDKINLPLGRYLHS
jgi:hypothetical protein